MADSGDPLEHAQCPVLGPSLRQVGDKVYASENEIRSLIAEALRGRLADGFRVFLGDRHYCLQPLEEAQALIANRGVFSLPNESAVPDSDDFALLLKAHFSLAAYQHGKRRPPFCFGLIWGELPSYHAFNWMINDDRRLRLIEPRTGLIFEPGPNQRHITFIMA